jgi:hypothetical protein
VKVLGSLILLVVGLWQWVHFVSTVLGQQYHTAVGLQPEHWFGGPNVGESTTHEKGVSPENETAPKYARMRKEYQNMCDTHHHNQETHSQKAIPHASSRAQMHLNFQASLPTHVNPLRRRDHLFGKCCIVA